MILYSIQELSAWIHLKTHGKYFADQKKSLFLYGDGDEYQEGIIAYDWLKNQYLKRKHIDTSALVWAWQKYNNKTDLFEAKMNRYYPNQAMIKLNVPDNIPLLSDFDDWNCCLNYGYVGENEQDIDDFYSGCDMMNAKDYNECVIKSWQRIFNIHKADIDTIQAVLPYLDLNWVEAVQIRRDNNRTKTIFC